VLRVKAELSGRRIKCPACQQVVLVPSLAEEPAEPKPLLPRRRSPAAGRSGPVWPFVAVPAGILAAVVVVVLLVLNSGKRERVTPLVEPAAPIAAPPRAIEPVVEAQPAAKLASQPTPAIVRLKPTDLEASDRLRREDIPPYELFAAGRGDPSQAPAHLVAIIGDSRLKHWAGVRSVAFNKDGRTLVTAGIDETSMIWELDTGKMRRSRSIQVNPPFPIATNCVALSPDGQTVALATDVYKPSAIELWDTATGLERQTQNVVAGLLTTFESFWSVAFSPDGKLVASAGSRTELRQPRRGPDGRVEQLKWKGDTAVTLWNAKTGRLVREMPRRKLFVVADCCFSDDGNTLLAHLVSVDARIVVDTVEQWDVKTGKVILSKEVARQEITSDPSQSPLSWISRSRAFMIREAQSLVCRDKKTPGKVRWIIFDLATGRERTLDLIPDVDFPRQVPDGFLSDLLGLSPDGKTLCLWSRYPKGLLFRNVATGSIHRPKEKLQDRDLSVVGKGAYSPDGKKLALFNGAGLIVWDVAGEKELLPRGRFRAGIGSVRFSPDGALLATSVADGLLLWDLAARTEPRLFDGYSFGYGHGQIEFSPDGRAIALVKDGKVRLCELATGRERMVFENSPPPPGKDRVREDPSALAFSPDGQAIALGYHNGALEVRDTVTGRVRQTYRGIAYWVTSVAFSPDGNRLAAAGEESKSRLLSESAPEDAKAFIHTTAGTNKTVKVWDVATGQIVRIIPGPIGPVAFSPDGQTLVTGGFDDGYREKIPLWDVATGKLRLVLQGHKRHGFSAAFSPNGKTIATWCDDGTVRLWDAATGAAREVITLCHRGGVISQVAFSPTGRYLATANGNGTVYILHVEDK